MGKYLKSLTFSSVLLLSLSCETPKGAAGFNPFTSDKSNAEDSGAQRAARRLTNNGTNFPTGQELARVVSNPGDIQLGGGADCPPGYVPDTEEVEPPISFKSTNGKSPFRSNGNHGPYGISLKNHPAPERGCYPVENVSLKDAKAAIASQNFSFAADPDTPGSKAPSNAEIRTFGAAVLSMQYLNGGTFTIGKPSKTFPFHYCDNASKSSRQFEKSIRISRKGNAAHGLSVGQYVHEWSHLIGNSQMPNGGRVYDKFLQAIGGKVWTEDSKSGQPGCLVSRYADNRSNEHFAEVFTAFVTTPGLLKKMAKTNPVCRKAYDFFEKQVFKKGERAKECY